MRAVDTCVDSSGGSPMIRPPGTVWRHAETGRYYWRIGRKFLPPDVAGRYSSPRPAIPLVCRGQTAPTRSKRLALACQRRLWAEWTSRPGHTPPLARAGIGQLIDHFEAWNRDTKGTGAKQAACNARICRDLAAGHELAVGASTARLEPLARAVDLTAGRIEDYLAVARARGLSARTIQAYRNSIHLFCRWLVRRELLDINPADRVDVAAPAKAPPRYLDDVTRLAFLRRLHRPDVPAWLRAAALVGLYAGPRLSSLRALRWEHVHDRAVTIPLTKQSDYAIVPLDDPIVGPELARTLGGLHRPRPGGPVFPEHHARTWGEAMAGLTADLAVFGELDGARAGNQWHLLRSTWAVTCARRGATLWQLMGWGGWKSPSIVTRYVNIARAARRLEPRGMRAEG